MLEPVVCTGVAAAMFRSSLGIEEGIGDMKMNKSMNDNEENSMNTKENKMKNIKEKIRSNKGKCVMIVAIIAAMLLSLLLRTSLGQTMKGGCCRALEWAAGVCAEMPVLPIETRRSLETWRVRRACEGSRAEYLSAVLREEKAFERRIDEVSTRSFAGLPEAIERTSSKFGYDKAWEIVRALAADKVAGGSRTQGILNRDLQEFYVQLLTARAEVWNECGALQQKLEKLRADYAQKVRGVQWNSNLGEIPESLQQQSEQIEAKINALVGAQVGSVVTVAVEAAFAKQGVKCMWRVLGGVAARLGTAAGAGLVVSQLDSPLPGPLDLIGAAIFAVGAYGAYSDVKEACVKLPSEMRKTMLDVADGQRREISESAKDECHRLAAAYLSVS